MSHRRTFLKQLGMAATTTAAVGASAGTTAATDEGDDGVDIDAGNGSEFEYPWQFIGRRSAVMARNGVVAD